MGSAKFSSYEKARDLMKSGEPGADEEVKNLERPIYVVHEHAASNHHFDLRLEIDGALKSWAVPKGPSTDPSEKRLAVETEDHPLAYAKFEGVIPEDEYGAGTVSIWDRGTFANLQSEEEKGKEDGKSLKQAYDDGLLEVELKGEKFKGGYALKRFRKEGDKQQWLLIKKNDEEADARRKPVNTEKKSVASGRTVKQIRKEEGDDS